MKYHKKCPDCEKRKKVTDEMLKANVDQVQQNQKMWKNTIKTSYFDSKKCRTCKWVNSDQESDNVDIFSYFALGIYNLITQAAKLDLIIKCEKCEQNEKLIEHLKNETNEDNKEVVSECQKGLKKKIGDCKLCNSISTGTEDEVVRGHFKSFKRRSVFEAKVRREIIEATANSILPGNSTLFPPPPPSLSTVDRQQMYSVRVYSNIRTPSPPPIDDIDNQSKETKGLNLSEISRI